MSRIICRCEAATVEGMRLLFSLAMRREPDDQARCLGGLDALPPTRLRMRSDFAFAERGGFEAVVRRLHAAWLALVGADRVAAVVAAIDAIVRRSRCANGRDPVKAE